MLPPLVRLEGAKFSPARRALESPGRSEARVSSPARSPYRARNAKKIPTRSAQARSKSIGSTARIVDAAGHAFLPSEERRAIREETTQHRFAANSGLAEVERRSKNFGVERIMRDARNDRRGQLSPPLDGRLDDVVLASEKVGAAVRSFAAERLRHIFPPKPIQPSTLSILKPTTSTSGGLNISTGSALNGSQLTNSNESHTIETRDLNLFRTQTPRHGMDAKRPLGTAIATAALRPQPMSPFPEPTPNNPGPHAVMRPEGLDKVLHTIDKRKLLSDTRHERQKASVVNAKQRAEVSEDALGKTLQSRFQWKKGVSKMMGDPGEGVLAAPKFRSKELHGSSSRNRKSFREIQQYMAEHEEQVQHQRFNSAFGEFLGTGGL